MNDSILTETQKLFLRIITRTKSLIDAFYLTGGTALAAFYLRHRYSEDLDFFSEKEIDTVALSIFFSEYKKELGFDRIDFQQSYNRNLFFLHFKESVLKTEFTHFPFPRIEAGNREMGVVVDSVIDIAVNKLFTIYQRTNARDYIDLYCLCREKKYSISDLIQKARLKFDWHIDLLQLGTQFVKAETVKDFPRMIIPLSAAEWQSFFIAEAKKLKEGIIKS